jgi:Neisseria PilC beta-propeller domain
MKHNLPSMKTTLKHFLAFAITAVCSTVLAQGSQTLPSGSFLSFKAQVVAPATSPTINSTHAISSNDFVLWTAYFQSKMTSPSQSDGEVTLPANFKWQKGTFLAPRNTTLRWRVGGNWQNQEPETGVVVAQVGWASDPLLKIKVQPVAGAVNFQGTGDGFRVIAYKDKLFVVNHHTAGTYLNCRMAETGSPCTGFANGGLSIPTVLGAGLASGAAGNLVTPNISIEHLNIATGEMFVYIAAGNETYMVCANLDTLKACMNAVLMDRGAGWNNEASVPIGSVGNQYYAVSSSSKLLCFDIALKAPCVGQPFNYGWSGWVNPGSGSTVMGGKLLASWDSGRLRCIDTQALHKPCAGWDTAPDLYTSGQAFPVLNADGTDKGVCTTAGCRALDGSAFTPSRNYNTFLFENLFWTAVFGGGYIGTYVQANTFATRVFHARSGYQNTYASCFDFATDAQCPNFPLYSNVGDPLTYTVSKDLTRKNCMWALGDAAKAKSFNPLTGGNCPVTAEVPPTLLLSVDPALSYPCDASAAKVNQWGKVRFSPAIKWGSGGLTRVKATIMDWSGNVLPAQYTPVREFPIGAFELSIADIPYATYPKLKIELTIVAGDQSITTEVGFDITWEGDPSQLCFKTQAPAVDSCGIGASAVLQTKATHIANYNETLTASTGFMPGTSQLGWGPRTSATTLSEKRTGLDTTQILQTRFNMNNYTGDLWQFAISSAGTLGNTPNYLASNNTSGRMFYTSTPNSATGEASLVSLSFAALSSAQQTALNQTLNGTPDTLGAQRLSYLMGDRSLEASTTDTTAPGKLRKRNSNLLGPVIDSSTTVLMRSPLAAYNDLKFPHYSTFKKATARSDTLAMFAANDGFLHGYKVSPTAGLTQAFSYMPATVLKRVQPYTDTNLSGAVLNPYRLNNTPMVADVNIASSVSDNQWRTVVVGNHGRGGRGVYALDVTSGKPDAVLFDYDNTTHADLADLGYMFGQPPSDTVTGADQIVRIGKDARWAYIAGNGVNSNDGNPANSGTGRAVLYIFYLNGAVNGVNQRWKRISVNQSANPDVDLDFANGLGTPRPVDTNGDGIVDLIYAGDKKGNLWRFNVRDLDKVSVTKIFKTPTAVAVAGQSAVGQAIYAAPVVQQFSGAGTGTTASKCSAIQMLDCWMVLFATGDSINPLTTTNSLALQGLYGVFDKGDVDAQALVSPTALVAQTLSTGSAALGSVRTLSANAVDYANGKRGWYVYLSKGEHATGNPVLLGNGSVMFATTRPAGMVATSCAPSMGWLTQLNPATGTGKNTAFKNSSTNAVGPSMVVNTGTGTFDLPSVLNGSTLNSRTHQLLISGNMGVLGGGDVSTITQSTDIMVGRMSWREVFGAPK